MDSNTKKVFNKLFKEKKTELASHKVDLGIIDNGRKAISAINDELNKYEKIGKQVNSLRSEASNIEVGLRNLLGNLEDIAKRVKKAEDELGEGNFGDNFLDYHKGVEANIKKAISKYGL